MSEEAKKRLNLVRYGGVVVTVVVFVALLMLSLLPISVNGTSVNLGSSIVPYMIGFTILAAVLSVAVYFGYRQVLMGQAKTP